MPMPGEGEPVENDTERRPAVPEWVQVVATVILVAVIVVILAGTAAYPLIVNYFNSQAEQIAT
jgi:hypothetical protein